ncbi:hypothetical protein CW304_26850 [Bacillus sp. UFRGS-B20]|nr:hypothetical protein CW304_26850 [Bacillus sp. UFRGS-B20]
MSFTVFFSLIALSYIKSCINCVHFLSVHPSSFTCSAAFHKQPLLHLYLISLLQSILLATNAQMHDY